MRGVNIGEETVRHVFTECPLFDEKDNVGARG